VSQQSLSVDASRAEFGIILAGKFLDEGVCTAVFGGLFNGRHFIYFSQISGANVFGDS
jgi:hypothetical protein